MGLPSAQLGSLPSMNLPTSIPTIGVQKSPKIWQQALMQILTQTAGNVVQQGIGNAMSRDYSEDPATGWQKLLSGPKVDKAQNMQNKSLAATASEGKAGREFTAGENRLARELTSSEHGLDRGLTVSEGEKTRAQQSDLAQRAETAAMLRLITGGNQELDRVFAGGDVAANNLRLGNSLENASPKTQAQTRLIEANIAETEQKIAQQRALQELMKNGGKPGALPAGPQMFDPLTGQPIGGMPKLEPINAQQAEIRRRGLDENWRPQ